MTGKTLILKSDKGDFETFYLQTMRECVSKGVDIFPFFKKLNHIQYLLMILHIQKFNLPFHHLWYAEWKYNVETYKNVIIFDRNYNWDIVKYIRKKNPSCRIIIWYWNTISNNRIPLKYRKYCEEWSFDIGDCKKYNLQYNTQFSFKEILSGNAKKFQYDMYFVGRDKGRIQILQSLQKGLESIGKIGKFIILKDKTSVSNYNYAKKEISYLENIEYLKNTRSILEIVQNGQAGITVRCVEALFLNIKIITNNIEIKNYDFYDPHYIYILNESTTIDEIKKFLEEKTFAYNSDIIDRYDFHAWLNRFKL